MPTCDLRPDGKPYAQYGQWVKTVQTHGFPKVRAWAEHLVISGHPGPPPGAKPGAWFGEVLKAAMAASFKWGWDETKQCIVFGTDPLPPMSANEAELEAQKHRNQDLPKITFAPGEIPEWMIPFKDRRSKA